MGYPSRPHSQPPAARHSSARRPGGLAPSAGLTPEHADRGQPPGAADARHEHVGGDLAERVANKVQPGAQAFTRGRGAAGARRVRWRNGGWRAAGAHDACVVSAAATAGTQASQSRLAVGGGADAQILVHRHCAPHEEMERTGGGRAALVERGTSVGCHAPHPATLTARVAQVGAVQLVDCIKACMGGSVSS